MFETLANELLILGCGSRVFRSEFEEKEAFYLINNGNIEYSSEPTNKKFIYFFADKIFNKNRPTVVYFHVNGGFYIEQIKALKELDFNIIIFPFYGYGENLKDPEISTLTLSLLVQQSEVIIKHLDSILFSPGYYGKYYKREEMLIFVGRSMGTLVTTKLAAKFEIENNPIFKVINIVSLLNMEIAIKTLLYRNPIILILILIVIISFYVPMSIFLKIKYDNYEIVKLLLILLIFFIIIPLILYKLMKDFEKIGITKEDIRKINKTYLKFLFVENDQFCNERDMINFIKGCSDNISIDKIIKDNGKIKLVTSNSEIHILENTDIRSLDSPINSHNSHGVHDEALKIILKE